MVAGAGADSSFYITYLGYGFFSLELEWEDCGNYEILLQIGREGSSGN